MDESAFPPSDLADLSPCEILKVNSVYMLHNDMLCTRQTDGSYGVFFFFFFLLLLGGVVGFSAQFPG